MARNDGMKIVAIIAVRNGEDYVRQCLDYLFDNNIDVIIIENDSTDGTLAEVKKIKSKHLLGVYLEPFVDSFDLERILRLKEKIRSKIEADWVIHQDVDEILQAENEDETLYDSICRIADQGFTAINFNEFVFVPESEEVDYSGKDYLLGMNSYYHFAPSEKRLIRAFKNSKELSNLDSGGHNIPLELINLYSSNLCLRHYIALSMPLFREKYSTRVYNEDALAKGWHNNRVNVDYSKIQPPNKRMLCMLGKNRRELDASMPHKLHFWQ